MSYLFIQKMIITLRLVPRIKKIVYKIPDDINYYFVPTPFTELMYKSVFVQGQTLV